MPWNENTPHQPVKWPHGHKSKGPKSRRKRGPLVNKPPQEAAS